MSKPNILLLDLECTNLKANFGVILCAGLKSLGQKRVRIIGIDDYPEYTKDNSDDSGVVRATLDEVNKADVVVAHYGDWNRFDLPFLNARALYWGLPPINPRVPICDTWKTARKFLALSSNRLATVGEFLGLTDKTPIKSRDWIRAMGGNAKALKYVKDHCIADVELLEQAYLKLRPLMTAHPNMALLAGVDIDADEDDDLSQVACPKCGVVGRLIFRRRRYATPTGLKSRMSCNACGAWSTGKSRLVKGLVAR